MICEIHHQLLLHHLTLERVQQLAFTTSDDPEVLACVLNRHLPKSWVF